MRKTIELEITNDQATELFNTLLEKSGGESAGRPVLARKYVYAYEKYLNCWSSKLVLVLTDNKEKFLSFVESRFENARDLDELDFEDFLFEARLND